MSDKPLVSVIIPDRNRPHLVLEAIRSVFSQSQSFLLDIEVILVIDHNPDYPRQEIRASYPKVKIINNTDKEGPGGSRNTGLAKAKGKYIAFLDSDDQWEQNFLSSMVAELEKNKFVVATTGFSRALIHPNFNFKERIKLYPLMMIRDASLISSYLFNRRTLFNGSFFLCQISHMLFKARAIKRLRFNYDYRRGGEDWDFFVQAMEYGSVGVVPRRLLLFRYTPGSSTDSLINRQLKWQSYSLLASRLPKKFKKGTFYYLFLLYIKLFGGWNV